MKQPVKRLTVNKMSDGMNDPKFEELLTAVLKAPAPPADLEAKLLAVAAQEPAVEAVDPRIQAAAAANDSLWRRILPAAAVMAVLLFIAWRYEPVQNPVLAREILTHVYAEEKFLESSNRIALNEVNDRMSSRIKAHLEASPATEALEVRFAKDCFVSKQTTMHLIITGETGPVSVMMMPGKIVEKVTAVDDDRFSGTITPVGNGTLIVLGNHREPIGKYTRLVQDNLQWEY